MLLVNVLLVGCSNELLILLLALFMLPTLVCSLSRKKREPRNVVDEQVFACALSIPQVQDINPSPPLYLLPYISGTYCFLSLGVRECARDS